MTFTSTSENSEVMSPQPTIYNIQILRGVAAMMVVIQHCIGQMESRGGRRLGFEFEVGQAGVDLFFVISGFIMVFVIHRRNQTPVQFWRNRICRIVPLYWFYTLIMTGIVLAVPSLLKTAEFNLPHILQSLFFIPAYHPKIENAVWPLLVQGWTLNYEMFFYLIFGAILTVKTAALRMSCLTVILVGLVILGLVLGQMGPLWQTYTSPLLLEFLAGALIGATYVRGRLITRRGAWGCLALGLLFFAFDAWAAGWTDVRILRWGLPSVLVVIAALGLETHQPGNRILRMLGDASYSTYLSHTFTIGVIGVVWTRFGNGSLALDTTMLLFSIAASAVIGIISYQIVERPMAAWIR